MNRVTGIGGIFFKARDPKALAAWYRDHLGLDMQPWGGALLPATAPALWSPFPIDTPYFAPGTAPFMVNFRVADLPALLETLRAEGCQVEDRMESGDQGRFGWVLDPEGNKVELWEPPARP